MIKSTSFLFFLFASVASLAAANDSLTLANESGSLRFSVFIEGGNLSYDVVAPLPSGDQPVVRRSPLGVVRTDEDFSTGLEFVSASEPKTVDDSYSMVVGKQHKIKSRGIERTFAFRNSIGAPLTLTVRAYPDGVAFRYGFPGESCQLRFITQETTGFHLPTDGKVWLQPYSKVATWSPAYEAEYVNGVPIGSPAAAEEGWALPALFQSGAHWVLVTEAGLDPSYFASHLEQKAEDGLYRLRPPEAPETYGVAPQSAAITLPWNSPWRLLIVGTDLNTVVKSNLVPTLAPPAEFADVSWIKPGRASWSWWSDMSSPSDYDKLLPFVDIASKLKWEYSTVDLGWQNMKNGDVAKLVQYASAKNVGLLLWYNSGGKHNQVNDAGPRNLMADPTVREAEMARIEKLGIKGIKVDFMQSDKQYVIALYYDILRTAARHHLLVDFHGATVPRGWSRTFPNLITMEAVAGAEQYWSEKYAENAQTIDAIYPFTRNVLGSMDYTPTVFTTPKNQKAHLTTNAHELALSVVFESGIQHFIDDARDLASQPDYVRDFLTTVPVTWDQTELIAGYPGELVIFARRLGHDWYLGGINGERKEKTVQVPLSFLSSGHYRVSLISDGAEPKLFDHHDSTTTSTESITVKLAARGGFVARLVPQ